MVGTITSADGTDPVPLVEILDGEHLDQMEADRLVESTGLREWVREVRTDDGPDTSRAIDPTPEALEEAARLGAEMGNATHVHVSVIAPGIRARMPLTVLPASSLN